MPSSFLDQSMLPATPSALPPLSPLPTPLLVLKPYLDTELLELLLLGDTCSSFTLAPPSLSAIRRIRGPLLPLAPVDSGAVGVGVAARGGMGGAGGARGSGGAVRGVAVAWPLMLLRCIWRACRLLKFAAMAASPPCACKKNKPWVKRLSSRVQRPRAAAVVPVQAVAALYPNR